MPASRLRRNLLRAGLALLALALVVLLAQWLQGLGGPSAPKRQVAKISILPDQPPPPPPPPKEEKPPPPREEPRQVVPEQQLKPADEPKPDNEPLKMEGEAGEGPSAFAAGTVRNEYDGGVPQTGPAASGAGGRDRSQERLYINSARQLLRDELEKHFASDIDEATAEFTLWLDGDGSIRRFELLPTSDSRLDGELQSALTETARSLRLPPPPARLGDGEALRFRLTVKPKPG